MLVALGPLLALTVEAWTIERRTAWGWVAGGDASPSPPACGWWRFATR